MWRALFEQNAGDADCEWLMVDGTVVSANAHTVGTKKTEDDQFLGRSWGGFSSEMQGVADGLGNPMAIALTAGQAGDAKAQICCSSAR